MNSIRKKTSIGLLVISFIAFISLGLPDGLHAVTPVWCLFVCFAALGGLGAGAIDAGINTYVAQHHSKGIMQWLHASFGIGITLGLVIMTLRITLTSRWQIGYLVICIFQGVLALLFFITRGINSPF